MTHHDVPPVLHGDLTETGLAGQKPFYIQYQQADQISNGELERRIREHFAKEVEAIITAHVLAIVAGIRLMSATNDKRNYVKLDHLIKMRPDSSARPK